MVIWHRQTKTRQGPQMHQCLSISHLRYLRESLILGFAVTWYVSKIIRAI